MIIETTVEDLFGVKYTFVMTTIWSRACVRLDAANEKEAQKICAIIIPYYFALGPSIVKLKKDL